MLTASQPGYPKTPEGNAVTLNLIVDDVTDIDAFYEQGETTGTPIGMEITDLPWGDRSFTVHDPDGYPVMGGKAVNETNVGDTPITAGDAASAT